MKINDDEGKQTTKQRGKYIERNDKFTRNKSESGKS